MARKAREISESGIYLVRLRGEELIRTASDEEKFLEILEKNLDGGKVYRTALTKSEITIVLKEGAKGLSQTMKSVTTMYARYFNRTHNREGKLFLGRFVSKPVTSEADVLNMPLDALDVKKPTAAKKAGTVKSPSKSTETAPKKPTPKPEKKLLPSWLL